MTATAREVYLESQVLTATPQKLRLLLIDGALRFAKQIVPHWENDDSSAALESVARCRRIITELLTVMTDDGSEIITQLRGIYSFMFRHLTEAQSQQNPHMVEEVIRLLEVERETWQLVCEQMPEAPQRGSLVAQQQRLEITAAGSGVSPMKSPAKGGFSLDA